MIGDYTQHCDKTAASIFIILQLVSDRISEIASKTTRQGSGNELEIGLILSIWIWTNNATPTSRKLPRDEGPHQFQNRKESAKKHKKLKKGQELQPEHQNTLQRRHLREPSSTSKKALKCKPQVHDTQTEAPPSA
ncbi:hypothetical protein CEXT_311471 [Caerostris extrusa]|uniref:Uncharacterized protein n=1 Tax=Caerostris extrusa TaxID=172846 RepID=A0AAV4W5X9_CAEEX|nr:hypothetical protein CEXT_311471 [Caerostris extrusa]